MALLLTYVRLEFLLVVLMKARLSSLRISIRSLWMIYLPPSSISVEDTHCFPDSHYAEPKVSQMKHHDPLDERMTNRSVSPMGMHS